MNSKPHNTENYGRVNSGDEDDVNVNGAAYGDQTWRGPSCDSEKQWLHCAQIQIHKNKYKYRNTFN